MGVGVIPVTALIGIRFEREPSFLAHAIDVAAERGLVDSQAPNEIVGPRSFCVAHSNKYVELASLKAQRSEHLVIVRADDSVQRPRPRADPFAGDLLAVPSLHSLMYMH